MANIIMAHIGMNKNIVSRKFLIQKITDEINANYSTINLDIFVVKIFS